MWFEVPSLRAKIRRLVEYHMLDMDLQNFYSVLISEYVKERWDDGG